MSGNIRRVRTTPRHRLYVGNLDYSMDSDDVRTMFEPAGEVVDVFLPRSASDENKGHKHKGFGFVQMGSTDETISAIHMLHGQADYYGRKLTVRLADTRKAKIVSKHERH